MGLRDSIRRPSRDFEINVDNLPLEEQIELEKNFDKSLSTPEDESRFEKEIQDGRHFIYIDSHGKRRIMG